MRQGKGMLNKFTMSKVIGSDWFTMVSYYLGRGKDKKGHDSIIQIDI